MHWFFYFSSDKQNVEIGKSVQVHIVVMKPILDFSNFNINVNMDTTLFYRIFSQH